MEFDHLVEKKQEQKAAAWLNFGLAGTQKLRPCNLPRDIDQVKLVRYDDGPDVIVRFAALGRAIRRREKVQIEVATMRWIHKSTSIPVLEVFGSGICWAGPYIVMTFLEGVPLSQILRDPSSTGRPVLNPQISNSHFNMGCSLVALITKSGGLGG
ncbi:hypothetical protein N7493_004401 [Penicillium malachiteum]|uniref:Aminoglycoside phosphotransferase domain-containing protein n=1 Tax=Penicillium malachiteum TaxID=1324776 RepID=A0AAD6HPE1_9EURO|nr:hypothetical protein N7493_004401 [Penicillium malachiteum]